VALLEKRRYLNNRSGDFPQVILIVPSHVPNRASKIGWIYFKIWLQVAFNFSPGMASDMKIYVFKLHELLISEHLRRKNSSQRLAILLYFFGRHICEMNNFFLS
jgi:hypothetical protein